MSGSRAFDLYGQAVEFHCTDTAALNELLDGLLPSFPLRPLTTAGGPSALRLEVTFTDLAVGVPPTATKTSSLFGLNTYQVEGQHFVFDESSIFKTHPRHGRGELRLHNAFGKQSILYQHNFILLGFFPLLLSRGFYDLHAAGLVYDDDAYLLIGESGSGKSTAALNLVRAGWQYLSDDALLLRRETDAIYAMGFRHKFLLKTATDSKITADINSGQRAGDKIILDMARRFPGQLRQRARPRVLVFTAISDVEQSTLTPLNTNSTLLQLIAQSASLSFNRDYAAEQLTLLRDLAQQCTCYELRAGRDVHNNPQKLAQLLTTTHTEQVA